MTGTKYKIEMPSNEIIDKLNKRAGKNSVENCLTTLIIYEAYNEGPLRDLSATILAIDNSDEKWTPPLSRGLRDDLVGLGKNGEGELFIERLASDKFLDPLVGNTTDVTTSPTGGISDKKTVSSKQEPEPDPRLRWQALAGPHINLLEFNDAEEDIFNLLERTIVRKNGWGQRDPKANHALMAHLDPKKMSRKGKKCGESTIRKAISRLCRLGVIAFVATEGKGRKLYAPAWDPRICTDPSAVFKIASQRAANGQDKANYWNQNDELKATDPLTNKNQQVLVRIQSYVESVGAQIKGHKHKR